jgi:hypothetical protein
MIIGMDKLQHGDNALAIPVERCKRHQAVPAGRPDRAAGTFCRRSAKISIRTTFIGRVPSGIPYGTKSVLVPTINTLDGKFR